jgi:hypothetical protein
VPLIETPATALVDATTPRALYSSRKSGAVADVSAVALPPAPTRSTTRLAPLKTSGSGLGVADGEAPTESDAVGDGVLVPDGVIEVDGV